MVVARPEGDWIEFAGRFFGFWGGALRVDSAEKSAFYAALGALPAQIFSIIFSCSLQFEVLPPLGE